MQKLLLRSPWIGPSIAVVILLPSVVGYAIVSASDPVGIIQACYQSTTGHLRLVQSEADCRPHERALSWNGAGPPSSSIAARIRDEGPVTLIPHETVEVPLSGGTWTQGENEFQDVVGQVQVDTPCPSFAVAVVPLIRVSVDGQERVTIRVTQPLSDFRIPDFEPGMERSHTLAVSVSERNCTQFGEATVQSVKVDVLRAGPGPH